MAIKELELKGIEDYSVEVDNLYEYYLIIIKTLNNTFPKEFRLSKAQADFLARCCEYRANGGDLRKMWKLTKYFVDNGYLSDAQQVRNRKAALGTKHWIKTGYNVFELPEGLRSVPTNYIISIKYNDVGKVESE